MTDLIIDLLPLFMFLTLMGLVFTSYPIGFALGGTAILFGFIGMGLDVFSYPEFFVFVPRVWSIAENLQIIAVPLFVFMGVMLERSRIAQDLLEALQMLLRPVPGGMALAVTLMGVIFAAITGVVGASVIMLTLIALPTMLKAGYRPSLALGTIAASSTLGILIPPSILIVFLSEMMQISFGYLFAAVIWPGLLLSGLYLLYIAGYAFLVKGAAPRLPPPPKDRDPREFWGVLARGIVPPAILIFLVMGSVLSGLATITESAAVGAGGALLLAWLRGNLRDGRLRESLHRSAMTVGMIFVLFIGATSFAFVFRILGGDEIVYLLIDAAQLDAWGILIMVIALIFLMGFFFDVLEIMLIAIPIFGPIVAPLDFGPHIAQGDVLYWFAVLVAITLQTSFLTPPMGLSLFYIKGVAPASITMRQIYVGIVPFVILQMLCVAIVMAEPELVTALPHWLFID
ncbi:MULTISPECIES: TRAP transporter large permease [Thalassobaculum]|uniref:TRAP transporter, DctM subunit n=1 Tax=Thalassobaculum litoreum DSM 18839 TaxID=1123362 RepID=A0A8G2BMJ5_9PROT|nr:MULTISPECIES: TRAP transporter large permease subunit [Thalassobaculum]SDG55679.1 TRAP transporter, DctM subunit [Thalassobaculum litoreum DSM 18839]